jgi:hypothetical protein
LLTAPALHLDLPTLPSRAIELRPSAQIWLRGSEKSTPKAFLHGAMPGKLIRGTQPAPNPA